MDFLIKNVGWIFGIVAIILLSIIGYFADKKEKNKPDNKLDDYKEQETQEQKQEEIIPQEQIENTKLEENNITTEIHQNNTMPNYNQEEIKKEYKIIPEFENVDNLGISLEDLENKNYQAIVNKKENNTLEQEQNNNIEIQAQEKIPEYTEISEIQNETINKENALDHQRPPK